MPLKGESPGSDSRPRHTDAPPPDRSPPAPGLIREGLFISILTILSKVLGVVREGLLAWAFGTSGLVDAFRVAQSGVFLLIHIFAGSVLDSAFLPTFKHLLTTRRARLAWQTAFSYGRVLLAIGVGIALFLTLFGEVWARVLAPGFDPERVRLAVIFLAAMAIAVPLGLSANLLATISNALYRFRIPALRATIQNIAVLGGILATLWLGSILWLGFSIPLALGLLLLLLVLSLRSRVPRRARMTAAREWLLWRFFGLALLPGTGLVLLEQANLIVERIVASHLQEGSIASLDYARFLVETPLVTLGVGITQTVLPKLSDLSAIGDREKLIDSTRRILLACLWALLPLSTWLISFGEDLVRVVYARGAFGEGSIATTSAALAGFAIGLWAWFGGTILQRAFYAERRLRILLPLSALGLATFGLLAILWAPRFGVRGVSGAFSIANIIYFAAGLAVFGRGLARSVIGVLAYLLIGGGLLYVLGPGIVPDAAPLLRLFLGSVLFVFAWAGWTILNPAVRRLALELVRTVGRAR